VSFSLNHSHQAIGLLSSDSYFSLYNVATLGRVFHRQLPTAALSIIPSSVQFCESHVLVGRVNNSHFDLVQITKDVAVLSTIRFTAPSPSPPQLHFAHAVYDPARTLLWVTPFARGSLYAFRYALKGQPLVQGAASENPPITIAFDRVAEYPFEPVLSFVQASRTAEEDAEIFFASPNGFSQAHITKDACASLGKSLEPEPQPKAVPAPPKPEPESETPKKAAKGTSKVKQSSKQPSPVVVKSELPPSPTVETEKRAAAMPMARTMSSDLTAPKSSIAESGISADELGRVLKKVSLDRLAPLVLIALVRPRTSCRTTSSSCCRIRSARSEPVSMRSVVEISRARYRQRSRSKLSQICST